MEAVGSIRQGCAVDAAQNQVACVCVIRIGPADSAVRTVRRPAGRNCWHRAKRGQVVISYWPAHVAAPRARYSGPGSGGARYLTCPRDDHAGLRRANIAPYRATAGDCDSPVAEDIRQGALRGGITAVRVVAVNV